MSTVQAVVGRPPLPVLPTAPQHRLLGAAEQPASGGVVGRVQPIPYVTLAGVDVAAGPAADGTWPALMVVDGLSVTWGRSEVLAQPDPATARLSLFDPSGVWAATADVIGQPVTLRWQHVTGDGVSGGMFFRGRVAAVAITRKVVTATDGREVIGALVELQCTSLLTDLANRAPAEDWPAETFDARTTRLAVLSAGPVALLTPRDYWQPAPAGPLTDGDNTTALEQLGLLFSSSGCDRMTYVVPTQQLDWLGRRSFPNAAGLAYLAWNPALRTGCYITALGVNRGDGTGVFSAPNFIDGRVVEYDAAVVKDMGSKLTRAQLTYDHARSEDGTYSATTITKLIPGTDEAIVGQRAATVTTMHTDAAWAEVCASDLAAIAAGEASGWGMDPMRWDTTRTGGFETIEQADVLLAGYELFSIFFLSGSWLPQVGIRPIFGVMGGSIGYARRGWQVEWNNAPVQVTGDQEYEITWDHCDAGDPHTLVWDEDDNPFGMHVSVTWEDLQFVAYGFGVTSIPTDGA